MGKRFSLLILIISIVATAVGTCLITLLGCYLFTRHRKAKQRAHDEEKEEANAALDRAIVSYIVKDQPSEPGSAAQVGPQAGGSALAMTTAVGARISDTEDHAPPEPPQEPQTPVVKPRQSLVRRTEPSGMDDSPSSEEKRTSSPLTEGSARVYADILARPLERVNGKSPLRHAEPAPAARDDVGWPLPSKGDWL